MVYNFENWKRVQGCDKSDVRVSGSVKGYHNHSQDIWDKLWFSYEVAKYGNVLISVFQEFFASFNKILILAGRLGARLSWNFEIFLIFLRF